MHKVLVILFMGVLYVLGACSPEDAVIVLEVTSQEEFADVVLELDLLEAYPELASIPGSQRSIGTLYNARKAVELADRPLVDMYYLMSVASLDLYGLGAIEGYTYKADQRLAILAYVASAQEKVWMSMVELDIESMILFDGTVLQVHDEHAKAGILWKLVEKNLYGHSRQSETSSEHEREVYQSLSEKVLVHIQWFHSTKV